MTIDTKHKINVDEAIKSFKDTVIGEIMELLGNIGVESHEWVSFETPLVLLREEKGGYVPRIFEKVTYIRGRKPFIILNDTDDNPLMSNNMTPDEVVRIFKKIFAISKNY